MTNPATPSAVTAEELYHRLENKAGWKLDQTAAIELIQAYGHARAKEMNERCAKVALEYSPEENKHSNHAVSANTASNIFAAIRQLAGEQGSSHACGNLDSPLLCGSGNPRSNPATGKDKNS